jgi:hypothetical protein
VEKIVVCSDCGAEATLRWREGGQDEVSPDGQGLRASEGFWYLSEGGCDCAVHAAALQEDVERLEDARRSAEAAAALERVGINCGMVTNRWEELRCTF